MKIYTFALALAVSQTSVLADFDFYLRPSVGLVAISSDAIEQDPAASFTTGSPVGEFKDSTTVWRLTGGVLANNRWDIALTYALYDDAVTRFAFDPPDIVSILPLDRAHTTATIETQSLSLLPSYRFVLSPKLSAKMGLGISVYWSETTWTDGITYSGLVPNAAPAVKAERNGTVSPTAVASVAYAFNDAFSVDLAYRYNEADVRLVRDEELRLHEIELGASWRF